MTFLKILSEHAMSYGIGYHDYYGCHEELLIEMCTSFGVSEEDVLLLLDYGYTADDVEEMLMDSDLLEETLDGIKEMNEYEDSVGVLRKNTVKFSS